MGLEKGKYVVVNDGCDQAEDSQGQKILSDFMATCSIQREILPNEVRDHDALDIFTCSTDHAPDFEYTKGMKLVGTIQMTFNEEDMNNARSWYNHRIGKWVRVLYYDIHVNMSADEGYLMVKVMNDKREMGAAVIEFY